MHALHYVLPDRLPALKGTLKAPLWDYSRVVSPPQTHSAMLKRNRQTLPLSAPCLDTSRAGIYPKGAGAKKTFQPMNVNFGLFPEVAIPRTDETGRRLKGKEKGFAKKRAMTRRALADVDEWLSRDIAAAE